MFIDKGQNVTLLAKNGEKIPLRLEVNPRAKRIILRIDSKKREAVAVAPTKRKLREASQFAADRIDWIIKQLADKTPMVRISEGAIISLRGVPCAITGSGKGRLPSLIKSTDDSPHLLQLPGAPETLGARALRYLKRQATEDLTRAVAIHSERLGVKATRISVKDTRSRWGSCTQDGRLSFSWRLIMAEPHVLDYVAAHEVAHLIEMNHSPAFWAQVERTYPDWKSARRWLRTQGDALYAVSA